MASYTLIEQVKEKLDITWKDTDTDKKIVGIIDNAEAALRYRLGIAIEENVDFETPGDENTLLRAYCLYDWSNASENEFEENYSDLLARTRAKHEVAQYEAATEA
jgi:hypothetical protein